MEKEKKDTVNKNVAPAAAMAAGIATGVGIGATVFAQEAKAEDSDSLQEELGNTANNHSSVKPTATGDHNNVATANDNNPTTDTSDNENDDTDTSDNDVISATDSDDTDTSDHNVISATDSDDTDTPDCDDISATENDDTNTGEVPNGDVEVISYSHEVNELGHEMDVAAVIVDGEEISFIDHDMDGQADIMTYDENGDGVVARTEHFHVEDMNIEMKPFQDAADENSMLAVNDPVDPYDMSGEYTNDDYINDADINSFMA